jgi:hypothetical protein
VVSKSESADFREVRGLGLGRPKSSDYYSWSKNVKAATSKVHTAKKAIRGRVRGMKKGAVECSYRCHSGELPLLEIVHLKKCQLLLIIIWRYPPTVHSSNKISKDCSSNLRENGGLYKGPIWLLNKALNYIMLRPKKQENTWSLSHLDACYLGAS